MDSSIFRNSVSFMTASRVVNHWCSYRLESVVSVYSLSENARKDVLNSAVTGSQVVGPNWMEILLCLVAAPLASS